MHTFKEFRLGYIIAFSFISIFLTGIISGCKTTGETNGRLQVCDIDSKSKCSGECIDGYETKYYFDSRNIQTARDEADRRIAFLKKQGLGDLDDFPEILNNEKKNAAFAKYSPPECKGCKPKFILKGKETTCEEFYQYIETLNQRCEGCIEIVYDKIRKN